MNPTPPKPPADALPDVKATPRTDEVFYPAQKSPPDFVKCYDFARQLETELRSSEAALAEMNEEVERLEVMTDIDTAMTSIDRLEAELTALRANAGEDSRRLDWLGKRKRLDPDPNCVATLWWKVGQQGMNSTVRTCIDAYMAQEAPPASLASGGEKTL